MWPLNTVWANYINILVVKMIECTSVELRLGLHGLAFRVWQRLWTLFRLHTYNIMIHSKHPSLQELEYSFVHPMLNCI